MVSDWDAGHQLTAKPFLLSSAGLHPACLQPKHGSAEAIAEDSRGPLGLLIFIQTGRAHIDVRYQ